MKRILSIAAALLFAAITVISPAVFAGGGPVVFSMNSVDNVSPGESFTITLSISGDYQAHGMHLSVEFDPNSMTLENCTMGDYLHGITQNGGVVVPDWDKLVPEGKIKVGVICPMDAATGSGDVLIMNFHVNEGVTVNQQVIMVIHEFIYMPLLDANGQPNKQSTDIPFSTHNSIITLRGGATPEAGYNEGDDGIGNNISSSPSQPPEPTPGGSTNTTPPIATVPPTVTNEPGTTPTAASESEQPYEAITASPDGTVTASPETSGEPIETITASPDGTVTASPEANAETPDENATDKPAGETAEERGGDTKKESKASPVPYIAAGAAAIAAVGAGIVLINKKKRG